MSILQSLFGRKEPAQQKASLPARTPPAKSNGDFKITVLIGGCPEPASAASWMFYAMARSMFVDQHQVLYQGQTGRVVPTFKEELFGRWTLADGVAHRMKQGDPPQSAYLGDLVRVLQAGYLDEYVWWFLGRPSWPREEQPPKLFAFMGWARTHLPNHVVQTYGGIEISRGESPSPGPPPPDVQQGGGAELRPEVDAISALVSQGRHAEAERRLEPFAESVRALQNEPGATYVCCPNARVFDYFMATPGAPRVVRVLDWSVAGGLFLRVFLRSQAGQFAEALSCLDEATRIAPLFAQPHVEAGYILNQLNRSREALEAHTRALDLSTRLAENGSSAAAALRGSGVTRINLGDLDGAEKHLRDSLLVEPESQLARNELAYLSQLRR